VSTVDQSGSTHTEPQTPKLELPAVVAPIYRWLDDRLGIDAVIRPILVHPVPRSTNWFNVLGSATLTAFIFQLVTGVFLALSYIPAPNDAYRSLEYIVNNSLFGHFIRGIHYWGGSAMVLLIFAHTARVFLTGSYKYPRELNWVLGVGLLFCTILMGFTGQLLVWNQDSYWAIVVGAEQAARTPIIGHWVVDLFFAGKAIGGATLTHFYVIHVFLVPGLMIGLITGHLYLVIYQGISEWPEPSNIVDPKTYKAKYHELLKDGIPFFPDAMAKDAIFALGCGIVVITLALIYGGAPLGHPADPTNIMTNPRPFWFLIWYYALLALIPPEIEDIVIIGLPALIMTWMLLLPFFAGKGERAASRRPLAVGAVALAVLCFLVMGYEGYVAPWAPHFTAAGTTIKVPKQIINNLPTAQEKEGAMLFGTHACTACHEVDGLGGIRGPAVNSMYRDFLADPQALNGQILTGGKGTGYQAMPAFGQLLTPQQTAALIAFIGAEPHAERGVPSFELNDEYRWIVVAILIAALFVFVWLWSGRVLARKRYGE
jgi:ubiquinol-cytochrome c reductase cytochrome b subunit